MAKDIKLYKDGNEIKINETQLDSFISLGWKQEKQIDSIEKLHDKESLMCEEVKDLLAELRDEDEDNIDEEEDFEEENDFEDDENIDEDEENE